MPFVRPPGGKGSTSLPYWLSPVVALSILSLGVAYYTLRFVLLPWMFRYELYPVAVKLSDGSAVTRYRATKIRNPDSWATKCWLIWIAIGQMDEETREWRKWQTWLDSIAWLVIQPPVIRLQQRLWIGWKEKPKVESWRSAQYIFVFGRSSGSMRSWY